MGDAAGMIAAARTLLGLGEDPPGSNHNKITEWYGIGNGPWCDMSISYEANQSGNLSAMLGKFAKTTYHATAFKNAGRWHYGLGGIRPGDVVFFDWSGGGAISGIDHVGLVEAVHSDGTITTLEGNTSDKFLRRTRRACVVGYGRPAYGTNSTPPPATDGMLRQGSKGNAVKALQSDLNTVMKSGLTVDGDFGAATDTALRAFQKKYGLSVDGVYGPASAAVMKAALKGGTKPIPPKPRPPTGTLKVDGDFGPATCAALQRALNTHGASITVDGAMGPLTAKALQKYLGVTQDGKIGPITIKALQKKVGTTQDGIWGSGTTTALQKKLNAGTF
jgi:peptidoglycan hydrolase-like protein with peptidoglycan-binding domain